MSTTSRQPRRQRKAMYEAHTTERRRRMGVALSRELRKRYGRRQVPPRKGDTVRVLSGSFRGREERVAKVDRRGYAVTLDNITGKTGDQKLKPLPIRVSHLLLTRLNLSDPWRRRMLRVSDAEAAAEAEPEAPAGGTPSTGSTGPAPTAAAPSKGAAP